MGSQIFQKPIGLTLNMKITPTKMEDDLTQNGRRPHPKRKTTSPKMEDDLTQNGRRPNRKTTKMEDDQNGRRPKWKTTKMEDDQNGRRSKTTMTTMKMTAPPPLHAVRAFLLNAQML